MDKTSQQSVDAWAVVEIEAPQGGDAAKTYAYGMAWTPPGQGGLCALYEDLRKGMTFQAWASRSTGKSALGVRHILREVTADGFAGVLSRASPALNRLFGSTVRPPDGLLADPRWITAPAAAVAEQAAEAQVANAVPQAAPSAVEVTTIAPPAPSSDLAVATIAPTIGDVISAAEGQVTP